VLAEDAARSLSFDLGIDHTIERADPFTKDRHIALLYRDNFHHWRRRGSGIGSPGLRASDTINSGDDQQTDY
jgi:hypothetical protein